MILTCSSIGVIASCVLLIGVHKDCRALLLPWIFIMLLNIFVEISHSFYIFALPVILFKISFPFYCVNFSNILLRLDWEEKSRQFLYLFVRHICNLVECKWNHFFFNNRSHFPLFSFQLDLLSPVRNFAISELKSGSWFEDKIICNCEFLSIIILWY